MRTFFKHFWALLPLLCAAQYLTAMELDPATQELLAMYPAPATKRGIWAQVCWCNDKQALFHNHAVHKAEVQGDRLKTEVLQHVYELFNGTDARSFAGRISSNQNILLGNALKERRPDLLALLLAHGPNPNAPESSFYEKFKKTPLDLLLLNSDSIEDSDSAVQCAKLLVAYGAQVAVQPLWWPRPKGAIDFPTKMSEFERPLSLNGPPLQRALCSAHCNTQMVQFLIAHGADVLDKNGYSFVQKLAQYPMERNEFKYIDILVSCGADIHTGYSGLPWVYAHRSTDQVVWLLTRGAAIDGRDEDGTTIIHQAIQQGDAESLHDFLTNATFTKTNAQRRASHKCLVAALCLFKRLGVCRDMRTKLVACLPQELISLKHAQFLMLKPLGVPLEDFAPYAKKEWIEKLLPTDRALREACIAKIKASIVAYRLSQLKKLFENNWLMSLHQVVEPTKAPTKAFVDHNNSFATLAKVKSKRVRKPKLLARPEMSALIDPHNARQHKDLIALNVALEYQFLK